ncbi:MAG: site-specific integrase [Bacteroidales bacterium]|nr:site-specific integrase [Bacteroidales bacterium]
MAEQNTFNLLFFTIKSRVNSKGEIPLHMRITVNKQKVELALHRRVNKTIWNPAMGLAMGNTKEAKVINNFLMSVQTSIYDGYKYLRETDKPVTPVAIKNIYLGIDDNKGKKILELYREHNDKVKSLVNIDYSPETLQRYETSLKHTRDFIKQKYNRDDLYLSEIDHDFITDYEIYFKTVRKCAHNTTMKYIKNFKKIVRLAIIKGELDKDPFVNFKMRLKKVDRGFLSEEELNTIIAKNFKNKRLEQIRDCFVFSCFTGLAHSDLKRLSHEHIVTGTDGRNWIKIKRKKTDNLSSIPILDVTQKLLDKYKNDDECIANNVLLPVKSNQKMNAYLGIVKQ